MRAPAGVALRTGIRRCIRNLRPGIALGSPSVLQLVIHEILQKDERARIAGVRIESLDESLQHRAEIARRVDPVGIGKHFESCAVEVEAAVEIRQSLAIVLIPQDGPLGEEVRRVGITGIVRNGPR